ncbi:hypothetical protein PHLGIDRAFT_269541 [Phlebiopsis gigantea 11061_1 CR5-6]|uniref:Uncharacterized protein n=1 Tax=Phlebiopsis gigantea (strain 11061_1 CR5-6) TaxID=745531 RepID=A0A0C3S4H8_PHLG1|nr:hypothetical protein PHLGIDRAFT_269541 [Phlebiopsis gigantea 11061_1 CR5-6]
MVSSLSKHEKVCHATKLVQDLRRGQRVDTELEDALRPQLRRLMPIYERTPRGAPDGGVDPKMPEYLKGRLPAGIISKYDFIPVHKEDFSDSRQFIPMVSPQDDTQLLSLWDWWDPEMTCNHIRDGDKLLPTKMKHGGVQKKPKQHHYLEFCRIPPLSAQRGAGTYFELGYKTTKDLRLWWFKNAMTTTDPVNNPLGLGLETGLQPDEVFLCGFIPCSRGDSAYICVLAYERKPPMLAPDPLTSPLHRVIAAAQSGQAIPYRCFQQSRGAHTNSGPQLVLPCVPHTGTPSDGGAPVPSSGFYPPISQPPRILSFSSEHLQQDVQLRTHYSNDDPAAPRVVEHTAATTCEVTEAAGANELNMDWTFGPSQQENSMSSRAHPIRWHELTATGDHSSMQGGYQDYTFDQSYQPDNRGYCNNSSWGALTAPPCATNETSEALSESCLERPQFYASAEDPNNSTFASSSLTCGAADPSLPSIGNVCGPSVLSCQPGNILLNTFPSDSSGPRITSTESRHRGLLQDAVVDYPHNAHREILQEQSTSTSHIASLASAFEAQSTISPSQLKPPSSKPIMGDIMMSPSREWHDEGRGYIAGSSPGILKSATLLAAAHMYDHQSTLPGVGTQDLVPTLSDQSSGLSDPPALVPATLSPEGHQESSQMVHRYPDHDNQQRYRGPYASRRSQHLRQSTL